MDSRSKLQRGIYPPERGKFEPVRIGEGHRTVLASCELESINVRAMASSGFDAVEPLGGGRGVGNG
jgi:hypothetical protein